MKTLSAVLEAILPYLGVIYFAAWSVSFYPQLLLNYRRKSATGFSFDFAVLNPLGFLCYTLYAILLRYDSVVRRQYAKRNGGHEPQVSRADVGFASHAMLLSSIGLLQVIYYGYIESRRKKSASRNRDTYIYGALSQTERDTIQAEDGTQLEEQGGRESLTRWGSVSLIGITVVLGIETILVATGKQDWLDLVYCISYIKLYISIAKWLPQLYINHILRSTRGFSIATVFLDLVGSFASLAELVIASYLANDLPAIWGNPLKLGLSAITLCTDGWFVGQKLVFGERRLKPIIETGEERQSLLTNSN